MKRVNQIAESRDLIARVFQELISDHEYNDITLTEIADHAGLARMTLHRHFKSKEKILLYMAQRYHNKVLAAWDGDSESVGELLLFRLEQAKNMPNRSIIVESREIAEILQSFRQSTIMEHLEDVFGIKSEEDPYLFYFLFGGINNVIIEWLKSGCSEPAGEIRDKILLLVAAIKTRNTAGKSTTP